MSFVCVLIMCFIELTIVDLHDFSEVGGLQPIEVEESEIGR